MGYPMTYQRVINRNGLAKGGYGDRPISPVNVASLLGDLRRLETDAVDERAVCSYIAEKLHADPELVAAVLQEFLKW